MSPKVRKTNHRKTQRFANTLGRDNPREKAVRSALHAAGFRFRIHLRVQSSRRTIDVAFPKEKIAVFLDGCFWHGCPKHGTWPKSNAMFWREKIERNVVRDAETTSALQHGGWVVLRFWEHTPINDVVAGIIDSVLCQRQLPFMRP
jgi:DNA mismatch endonuclease (patch repair protein)